MHPLSAPRKLNVAALVAAAAGILILFAAIPDEFPPVPPGPIILLVAAGLMAFAPGRRKPLIGVIAPLFIFVGGFLSGAMPDLLIDPENVGAFVGVVIQMLGLITAIATGALALRSDPAPARRHDHGEDITVTTPNDPDSRRVPPRELASRGGRVS